VAFVSELSRFGRVYVRTISLLGLLVIGESLLERYHAPVRSQWLLLAALTLISGSASVKLPWAHVSISISEAFVFTAVLLYGPAAGTLTVALDGLVISAWIARRRPDFHRALFNVAAPAVSAWCSAQVFFLVSGIRPLAEQPAPLDAILPSLVLFTVTYFGLNSWLIAIIIAVEKGENAWVVWRRGFIWLSLNYFCGASVAVLLIGSNRSIDVRFVGLIVPVLLVLYFTFKTTMQRVEDANKHVEQLNKLYLSTIETLAMAVDAKDQVTHGHIRRVQSYATQLARKIGIRDEHLLKAIEAAALLHDMGKLAIPEHILNKPGKLTPAEFDKMKLHASIGAEILSAIDFPYPVVPIVRHHHENWDGTGYPDGLRGTDVPIGARILSVVDCFDALTSDRPYRPRLSDEDALTILIERRGSMYDPLVVDTFVRVYRSISPEPSKSTLTKEPPPTIAALPTAQNPPNTLKDLNETADANGMLALYDLARALAGNVSVSDAGDIIAKHLKRLIPFSVCIFYLKDRNTDELEATHAVGDRATELLGVRIALGQRLSGWVAANRQTICNSDSALDLWDLDRPDLRSCLSTPLVFGDTLIGVLTVHSPEANAFSEDHRRIIELTARTLSDTLRRSLDFDLASRRDPLTGLPASDQLDQLLRAVSINSSDAVERSSLILIDVLGLAAITERLGTQVGNNVLLQVVRQVRSGMRASDLLFRSGSDELVAFLPDSDTIAGEVIADRMREHMHGHPLVDGSDPLSTDLQFTCVPVPDGDYCLHEVLAKARSNARTAITLDACPVS
jgi:diguanylate cyclase (GGDEF)-like protein/putative nucleotidyltransferase with HDIG domain